MPRVRCLFALACAFLSGAGLAASSPAPTKDDFEGVWLGQITAPNATTPFGLAFTRTEKDLLVSVYMPEMFLYGANFGPAEIHDGVFQLPALNLRVSRTEGRLTGVFATAALPVELHRGGSFLAEPAAADVAPAPNPAWTLDLKAAVWATPVARNDVIYVGSVDGTFYAINAERGTRLWSWSGKIPIYGEALATEDSVFFANENGVLICLARTDGALKWQTTVYDEALGGGPAPKNETFNHRAASPVIDAKNILYIGSADGGIYAVKASNGKKLWRHDAKTKFYSALGLNGEELVAGGMDGTVLRLNRTTRREIIRTKVGGAVVSTPVIAAGRIIVGSRDYMLYGLDLKTGETAWRNSYWFSWVESTPRFVDGVLYIGGSDFRRVSAIEPATGRILWATDVHGLSWGSPVVAADTVYVGTAGQNIKGTVIKHSGGLVAVDRNSGLIKWRYAATIPSDAEFTGFAGSLVTAAGKIIGVEVNGRVVALPVAAATPR